LPVLSWRADGKPASLLWSSAVVWPDFSKLLRFFMAAVSIVIPEMGESVRTGVVAKWHKPAGAMVKRDEIVMDLETDKITAEITAPADGVLKHGVKVGDTVAVPSSVGEVDPAGVASAAAASPAAVAPVAAKAVSGNGSAHVAASAAAVDVRATPLAKKVAEEKGVSLTGVQGTGPGGRIREQDVLAATGGGAAVAVAAPVAAAIAAAPAAKAPASVGGVRRVPMTTLRQRIAERLVSAQHSAAMLTTFNEVDMTAVMELRKRYKEEFEKRQGVGLGFMSFFVKAAAQALRQFPQVNSFLVAGASGGVEIEHHDYVNISVAVSTPKGLTVPVLRNCQELSFAGIESGIKELAVKARDGKLSLDDLQGGTFTITNGGVFGSLISTPILNAPQSAILGMHAIKNRPVEHPDKPGEIALRPMMYLALSYDHRILDGSDAVQFLVAIKNGLERPERLMLGL
jgi:2-oxoglutarate dehydrogenase E2 component (dihydrolipoamide succinyltransferase)